VVVNVIGFVVEMALALPGTRAGRHGHPPPPAPAAASASKRRAITGKISFCLRPLAVGHHRAPVPSGWDFPDVVFVVEEQRLVASVQPATPSDVRPACRDPSSKNFTGRLAVRFTREPSATL